MTSVDIRDLAEKLNFPGNKGMRGYQFKGKNYQVLYEISGSDTTLLSIKSV